MALSSDEAMRLALAQARRSSGRTFPNPSVGAVVYRGGEVLGRGRTRPPGGSHAEVVAIEQALRRHGARRVRGASLAVTLEPCCHTGRTPPCTRAIIDAGIARVAIGARDPHPLVAYRSVRRLRAAGIEVELEVQADACALQHRGFLSVCHHGRPFVVLKLATTLDGRIATRSGESRWITGEPARALVHRMRARTDAVMVGSQTARADDPALTARRGERVVHRPVRVLVDSALRAAPDLRLYRDGGETWVLHGPGARGTRTRARSGARLLEVRRRGEHLDLAAALARLGEEGLTEVLVEGGGELAAALVRERLVDEVHWLQAPLLLGGDARPSLGALEVRRLADAVRLHDVRVRRLGADIHVQALVGD